MTTMLGSWVASVMPIAYMALVVVAAAVFGLLALLWVGRR